MPDFSPGTDPVAAPAPAQAQVDRPAGEVDLTAETSQRRKRRDSAGAVVYSESFEAFWAVCPSKVGKDKAFDAWRKVKIRHPGVSPPEIIAAMRDQARFGHFVGSRGDSFIPHPATWLNQARWQDEIKGLQAVPCEQRQVAAISVAEREEEQERALAEFRAMARENSRKMAELGKHSGQKKHENGKGARS